MQGLEGTHAQDRRHSGPAVGHRGRHRAAAGAPVAHDAGEGRIELISLLGWNLFLTVFVVRFHRNSDRNLQPDHLRRRTDALPELSVHFEQIYQDGTGSVYKGS